MEQRVKSINFHFMVNEEGHELIKRQKEQSDIRSLRSYLLKMVIDWHIFHVELDSVLDMVRLLSTAYNIFEPQGGDAEEQKLKGESKLSA